MRIPQHGVEGRAGGSSPRAAWSLRASVLVFCVAISACGGADTSPTEPPDPPPNNPPPSPPPPPPPPPVITSVSVTPATDTLAGVGDTTRLTAIARDAAGAIVPVAAFTWSSSNQAVVTVNAVGLVTAVAAGTASITAVVGSVMGTSSILVLPPTLPDVGAWTGFTTQNNAIGFVITNTNRLTQLGLSINVSPPGGGTCAGNFVGTSAGVSLAGSTFADSVSGIGIGLSRRVPLSGTRASATLTTGTVSGYNGSFAVVCGSLFSIGTGTLWSSFTYEARPLIPAGTDLSFTRLTSGAQHSCGLTSGGVAWCWGENGSGQLGDGTTTDRPVPTLVSGGRTFSTISAGFSHTCALTTDGAAWCWGSNANGRLGDGTTTNRTVPTAVATGVVFTSILAPANTCALSTAGAAWCWGNNFNGQVGDGTNTDRSQPTAVQGGHVFTSLGGGSTSFCGITTAGATYCWGDNGSGQLGDGTTTHRSQPVLLLGGLSFRFIGTGRSSHVCGITTGDDLYCWGDNEDGQVGDSSTTDRTQPVRVAAGVKFTFVSTANANASGSGHTCAVRTDGITLCWGGRDYGKSGNGAPAGRSLTPVEIFGGVRFDMVSAGGDHSCGLSRTGVTYCWGRNQSGQTGHGRTAGMANYPMPVRPIY